MWWLRHLEGCSAGQCNTVQFNSVQFSAVQCRIVRYNTVQYNAVQCTTEHNRTVQDSTVLYSTVQYSTVQYCAVQCSDLWSSLSGLADCRLFLVSFDHKYSWQARWGPAMAGSKMAALQQYSSSVDLVHCQVWSMTWCTMLTLQKGNISPFLWPAAKTRQIQRTSWRSTVDDKPSLL